MNVDTSQDINTVEWFFGYGGNHLGLKRVLPNLRLLAACEIEEFAVENILAKMEAGLLEAAPIWSDCKTFPWEPFVDRTHLFVASYPCQPFSAAGKRQGAEDERHLWPYVYRWILRARPLLVFLENVEGHVSLGLSTVISDLEEGGYKATWGIFSASEVGAPHQRKRVFILAERSGERGAAGLSRQIARQEGIAGVADHGGGEGDCVVNASSNGREYGQTLLGCNGSRNQSSELWAQFGFRCLQAWPSRPGEPQFWWEPPRVLVDNAAHTNRRSRVSAEEAGAGPEDIWRRRSGESGERQTQPPLGRDADGPADWLDDAELFTTCDNRTDELRLLGNGVVPATAERAFRVLVGELMEHENP